MIALQMHMSKMQVTLYAFLLSVCKSRIPKWCPEIQVFLERGYAKEGLFVFLMFCGMMQTATLPVQKAG